MEAVVKMRTPLRSQITRLSNELSTLCLEVDPDLDEMRVKFDLMMEAHQSVKPLDEKILQFLVEKNASDVDIDEEVSKAEEYQVKVRMNYMKTMRVLNPNTVPVATLANPGSTNNPVDQTKSNTRLPKIELKKFNGEIKDWLGFWAQFERIHEDTKISDSEKFQYLVQSMEPGSRAQEVVESFPQSAANYANAVEKLKARFGKKELQVEVYVRELLKLVVNNVMAKDKLSVSKLFDKLETHLRALETLGVKSETYAAMLYPMVESAMSVELMRAWQRSVFSSQDGSQLNPPKSRLDFLMDFLRNEVESEERITLAREGFQSSSTLVEDHTEVPGKKNNMKKGAVNVPSLAGCHDGVQIGCIFCGKSHETKDCFSASSMTLQERTKRLRARKVCMICFGTKHFARNCRAFVKCLICQRRHHTVMCPGKEEQNNKQEEDPLSKEKDKDDLSLSNMANQVCVKNVALQTLMITILAEDGKKKTVRAFIDNGSQRSYILKSTAVELGLVSVGEEEVSHSLFGGTMTEKVTHMKYKLSLQRPGGGYRCTMMVRDQKVISNSIPRISRNSVKVFEELKQRKIWITDVGDDCPPIEVLIGADIWAKLLTGNIQDLICGYTAIETHLGWTLSGEVKSAYMPERDTVSMMLLDMHVSDCRISELWDLEKIGIQDSAEVQTEKDRTLEAKEEFLRSLSRKDDGRYVVALPWAKGHPTLPENREVAVKRLHTATVKLMNQDCFDNYSKIFTDWEAEGFIEKVPPEEIHKPCHYLPHRPVMKESLTTPVRPVFDASCRVGKHPSLNDCLEKGENYVKMILDLLIRFRERMVGVAADIRKAFQMVEVRPADRDMLRFIWWEDQEDGKLRIYRHNRVVFGATCSPFILGAVLEYHLDNVEHEDRPTAQKLLEAMYVDNCVTSTDTYEEYVEFRRQSIRILEEAKMDLRMWFTNLEDFEDPVTTTVSVLGLLWNRKEDTLSVDIDHLKPYQEVTKRTVLSVISQIFDPLGLLSPALIPMKIMLQDTWASKAKWDEELPENMIKKFEEWYSQLNNLKEVKVPRIATAGVKNRGKWSLHTFTDASKSAFAAVIFLRVETEFGISVQLLAAKARVAPLKNITIPRLELLGCLIGSRLASSVKEALRIENVAEYYWSDSSTALCWIKREDNWGTFVGNRVKEICSLTNSSNWRHVPGDSNPADLPSRGCSPSMLLMSRWSEGPPWLKESVNKWPSGEPILDEDTINQERKKTAVASCSVMDLKIIKRSYTFAQTCRIYGWILRFYHNMRIEDNQRKKGPLSEQEIEEGMKKVVLDIQKEAYPDPDKIPVCNKPKYGLTIYKDEEGLLRVKTKIALREDLFDFKYPYLLPRHHPLVLKMISEEHYSNCHAGVGFLMCKIREKFWVTQSRRTIQSVLNLCFRCRRFSAKPAVVEVAPLPVDRVKNAEVFEVIGVDLAGPIFLKNKKKCWIVIITCAVFRAVHLDVVMSLSTNAFIGALKKFILKYGRPDVIFSDNGTNFVGASNLFAKLDWEKIQKEDGVSSIKWKFNPPSAAWWGGFWERLIRTMKDLLKRTCGKASLSKEEFVAVLSKVEEVMNGRPLTYVSEDPEDLSPLTPAMFLKPKNMMKSFPEGDILERDRLQRRYKYIQTLKSELHSRFRKEYLSQLLQKPKGRPTRALAVGEIVVIGSDNKKRLEWPLGRIVELYEGKDGIKRVAKLMTQDGFLVRAVQRLHPLEVHPEEKAADIFRESDTVTRSGRKVKVPLRLNYC